jgi:SAM-dependent methyltransferase
MPSHGAHAPWDALDGRARLALSSRDASCGAMGPAMHDRPEISDLVVDYDPDTLVRRPVPKARVLATLRGHGMRAAQRIVEAFPAREGVLDAAHVDAVLVSAHLELQRLHEEFLMGYRVSEVLVAVWEGLRRAGAPRPYHVVDLGCGLGFVLRWMARHGRLGPDVTLTGADYNVALARAAGRLAAQESLPCRFVTGNAFRLAEPAREGRGTVVFISTGVLHHFRGDGLSALFAQHAACDAAAAVHFDIKPTPLAPVGAWVFHHARMRQALARHDGTLSALRAHPPDTLLEALATGAPTMRRMIWDGAAGALRLARIMHAVVGIAPAWEDAFRTALGGQARRLGAVSGGAR